MNMKKPRMMKVMDDMKPEGSGMPRFGARAIRPGGMAKGGKVHEDAAMDKKLIRKEIARAGKMEDNGMKKGGKVPMAKFEHSKADLAQDKKLAAKRGMSLESWEKSAADKKHDTQQSMKGLKKGGGVMPAKDPASKDLMAIKDTPMGRKMAGAAMGIKKMAKGGGVETKGKTKGRFI